MLAELSSILRALAENEKIRCIVTTGGGDSYSSGRDLYDMRGQDNRRRTRGFGGVAEIVDIMRKLPQVTVAKVRGWCLGGGLALINGHDLVIARRARSSVCRKSSAAATAPPRRRRFFTPAFRSRKLSIFPLPEEILTGIEAERVGLVSHVVPEKDLDSYVETLAKELASRNGATLENAKIAAYMQKDLPFDMALRADDLVQHRLRYYTNPLSDVEGYLHSQKGGASVKYIKPEDRK